MFLSSCLPWTFSRSPARRGQRRTSVSRRKRALLSLEHLEGRALLASYPALTVSDLIADINLSNKAGGANTITLTAPTSSPYRLLNSPLPEITATDNLTIVGNSDNTITPEKGWSMIAVAPGATLTLDNLQVRGFTNEGGKGGAIYNQGALTLSAVTVSGNKTGFALYSGSQGQSGAIWSSGSLTLENGTLFENNTAIGGQGTGVSGSPCFCGSLPGNAYGGAVYIAGGTANISDTTFEGNIAEGGISSAGPGGAAYGGALYVAGGRVAITTTSINGNQFSSDGGSSDGAGLYVAGGTVTLTNDTVESNSASSAGGGIYIVSSATVYIDPFTVAHVVNNTASTDPNIDGTYILT